MSRRISIVFVLFFASFVFPAVIGAQEHHLIVSFERKRNKEVFIYHWLLMEDEQMAPLFLPFGDGEYRDITAVDSVFLAKIQYPFREAIPVFPGNCLNDLNGEFAEELSSAPCAEPVRSLLSQVQKNKRKVQVIKKKWADKSYGKGIEDLSRHDELITVYLTPVIGSFQKGWKYEVEGQELLYSCYSYRPISIISYDSEFWGSPLAKRVMYLDFSFMEFARYTPRGVSSGDNINMAVARAL